MRAPPGDSLSLYVEGGPEMLNSIAYNEKMLLIFSPKRHLPKIHSTSESITYVNYYI